MSYDVSVIGLGRVGLPLALCFADRGLLVLGVDNDADRLGRRCATRACRSRSRAPTSCSRACTRRPADADRARRRRRAGRRDRAHARHAVVLAHRDRHGRHPRGARRPAAGAARRTTLIVLRSTVAPGHDRLRRRLPREAARLPRRRGPVRRPRARAHRGRPLPGGDRHAAVHRRRRRRGARASARRGCSSVLGAPIVQTTPVQAELAKIWTNILRYATFALPNLLMMDCERYGANVFDVIELINRDYPRGGIAMPGPHRRDLPAQGLRVLGGALERARHAARRLARARVGAAVPGRRHQAPARRSLRERKVAVLGLAFKRDTDDERDSLSHKLVRLLERELADVAVHDPVVATPTAGFDEAVTGADVVVVATNHSRVLDAGGAARDRRPRRARLPGRRSVERVRRRAGVRLRERGRARLRGSEPRPRHRRRRHDRRGGRPPPARATPTSRSASPTSARRRTWMREGCEVHTGDLRDARRGAQGDRAAART